MVILGVVLFALLVVVHEYGHFIAARRNGIEVEEFGIGFPPRLFGKRFKGTLYSFNLVPLGGFVKLKGESDADVRPGSFGAASLYVKAKVLLAGVGMNVLAVFVIILILALTSLPEILPSQFRLPNQEMSRSSKVVVARVVEGSPAANVGVQEADRIMQIGDAAITSADGLRQTTRALAGDEVIISFERDGQAIQSKITIGSDEKDGYLGVMPLDLTTTRYSFWAAPVVAAGITLQMLGLVLGSLGSLLAGLIDGGAKEATAGLTGPVGIVFLLNNLGAFGFEFLLFLIASIGASLAVFNALPIPALDGGRLALIAASRLIKKGPLSEKTENAIHGSGFMLLLILFALITYVDIKRFF